VPVRRLAVVALALGRVRAQVPNVLLASVFLTAMVARQESENPELPLQRQPVEFLHEHHHRRRSQTGPTGSSPSPPVPFFFASFLSRVFLVCSSSPCRGTDGCAGFFLSCEDTIKLLILVSKGVDVFDNGKI